MRLGHHPGRWHRGMQGNDISEHTCIFMLADRESPEGIPPPPLPDCKQATIALKPEGGSIKGGGSTVPTSGWWTGTWVISDERGNAAKLWRVRVHLSENEDDSERMMGLFEIIEGERDMMQQMGGPGGPGGQ